MSYSGKFTPKNKHKYEGNHNNIVFRSLWELQAFKWCDSNADVVLWSSEEVCVPYMCRSEQGKIDRRPHRYFVDLKIQFRCGKTVLVEIKPKCQVQRPQKRQRKTQKYLQEVLLYVRNVSKWEAAHKYADKRGWLFEIWTEDTLKSMGIKGL